ncbi:MAG: hypothetical protein H8E26_14120 [FCB group bacterium]|nr:hypothetical protein [FCB group bacterium]MBL7027420.1 hypothetical protein [Candidatus Neomarinimicrobiota bacterium]MBL7122598.1 hypothetical protein [Candidatus Neomarinimicrobiota bacterium]
MATKLKLKKPTPKALKIYKKHGLLNDGSDNKAEAMALLDLYTDEEAFREVIDVTFVKSFTDEEIEELDLQAVGGGIMDFFFSSFVRSPKSAKPNTSS